MVTGTRRPDLGVVSALLAEESFRPAEPVDLAQAGLTEGFLDGLLLRQLLAVGNASGRGLAEHVCLPMGIVEPRLQKLRSRQYLMHKGAAPLNDYVYGLTDLGRDQAQIGAGLCAYAGAAPVPLQDYITSVDAQTITAEAVTRAQLADAFRDISVPTHLLARIGPAVNSGAGLFLYGAPGNGKTTLAERITHCFGREIWIPRVVLAEGEIIKLFDPAYHKLSTAGTGKDTARRALASDSYDKRWVKISRPTVVAGGELTMDALEIHHNARTNISEAPLQMKSNSGSLLIDDFGRQRMDPLELLNRWIVPLEKRYDFLTLASGKKIQVPFDQLIIFSTNLEPRDLVDEAFLRRIPYKVNVPDPDEEEFHELFARNAPTLGCEYRPEAVDHLLAKHYRPTNRARRRCHPRDLLMQIRNVCAYSGTEMEMRPEYFDHAVENYFTVVG
jgi:predicted ATPase with chaperone activity